MFPEPIITPENITTPSDTDPKLIKTEGRLRLLVQMAVEKNQTLDLKNCTIETEFNLKNLLGREKYEKIHSHFRIHCLDTIFEQKATFENFTFEREFYFSKTTFRQETNFNNTTFEQKVTFNNTIFEREIHFYKTIFQEPVDFIETKFEHPLHVFFNETNFRQTACFSEISFKQTIDFSNTNFKTLVFDNITFDKEGNLQFRELPELKEKASVTFKNIDCDSDEVHIKIRRIQKEAPVHFYFEECHFYGKNVAFTNVHMQHVTIKGGNTVNGMLFDHCHFVEQAITRPTCWLERLPEYGFWWKFKGLANETQYLNDANSYADREKLYANLKTTATQAGETQLSNHFHFWQLYYQGKQQPWFLWWNKLYFFASAYGQSVLFPFIYFCILLGIGGLVYDKCLGIPNAYAISLNGSVPFLLSNNKSFQTTYFDTIKSSSLELEWLFWVLYCLQQLIQGFLIFQIGAAIRNQVKK